MCIDSEHYFFKHVYTCVCLNCYKLVLLAWCCDFSVSLGMCRSWQQLAKVPGCMVSLMMSPVVIALVIKFVKC